MKPNLPLRCYQVLLWTYPPRFRREFGADMVWVFEESYLASTQKSYQFWLRMAFDALGNSLREWLLVIQLRQGYMMDIAKFDQQFRSSVALFSRALRGGYSVKQSAEIIADSAPEPTATVFRTIVNDIETAGSAKEALATIETRVASTEFQEFVAVMRQQYVEGGNLAQRLETLIEDIPSANDWAKELMPPPQA